MKRYTLKNLAVPNFPELSVGKMYPALKDDELIKQYLPDYPDGYLPNQEFFHGLMSTLNPKEFFNLIIEAYKSRSVLQNRKDEELIEVCKEMQKELKEVIVMHSNLLKLTFINYSHTWKNTSPPKNKIQKGKKRTKPKKFLANFSSMLQVKSSSSTFLRISTTNQNVATTSIVSRQDVEMMPSSKDEEEKQHKRRESR